MAQCSLVLRPFCMVSVGATLLGWALWGSFFGALTFQMGYDSLSDFGPRKFLQNAISKVYFPQDNTPPFFFLFGGLHHYLWYIEGYSTREREITANR